MSDTERRRAAKRKQSESRRTRDALLQSPPVPPMRVEDFRLNAYAESLLRGTGRN